MTRDFNFWHDVQSELLGGPNNQTKMHIFLHHFILVYLSTTVIWPHEKSSPTNFYLALRKSFIYRV